MSSGSSVAGLERVTWRPRERVRTTTALAVLGVIALALAALPGERAVIAALTGPVLVVLSAIDIQRRIIPNRIVLPAAALVLVVHVAMAPAQTAEWVLAPLTAAVVLAIPTVLGRDWIGMGDAKLALLLGAALGWGVIVAVLLAFVSTLPAALFLVARDGIGARKSKLAMGPFLALGAMLVMFGPSLLGLSS